MTRTFLLYAALVCFLGGFVALYYGYKRDGIDLFQYGWLWFLAARVEELCQ